MQKISEKISQDEQRELIGLYIFNADFKVVPIIPTSEPLTAKNFRIIVDSNTICTADDFSWYAENGSRRDFRLGDDGTYIESAALPKEVWVLLNVKICTQFAIQHLNEAKLKLKGRKSSKAKQAVEKAIAELQNLNETSSIENFEKLKFASDALEKAAIAFKDTDKELNEALWNASSITYNVTLEFTYRICL